MNRNKKRRTLKAKTLAASAFAISMAFTSAAMPVFAAENSEITPVKASYGYYVDTYTNNDSKNMTPESNPSIGVLSEMLDYFTPGDQWNNGTILNAGIHKLNLEKTAEIANNSTQAEQDAAYLDDRRNQNYSMISGLGVYSDEFIKGTNAGTTITDKIPDDATTVKYDDNGNSNGNWADSDTEYGGIVDLVATVRGGAASTSSAKKYYKYMRPFRWSRISSEYPQINIISTLKPCEKSDPSNDGGYNSGHTNAAYLAAISMAYAVPEQYQQMILRASELGNNRIVAGMHSCLDVIGGRMSATAIAASNLYDTKNADVKAKAIADGKKLTATAESNYTYEQYLADKEVYLKRLTYGIKSDKAADKKMVVPKGAEVLIESRFPYLDATQRRYVLYTTGISSGYSILDDAEGWGRLNLFEAAAGYGSFVTDVTVNMDAKLGGYNAADRWMNDIDGTGSLTKEGTGTLSLYGNNSYAGGTIVNGGTVVADSATAFGTGNVTNNAAVKEDTTSAVNIAGSYSQNEAATLELTISNSDDILNIANAADFKGSLIVNFVDGYVPEAGTSIITFASNNTKFDNVTINGVNAYNATVEYTDNAIKITNADAVDNEIKTDNNIVNEDVNANQNSDEISNSPKTADMHSSIHYVVTLLAAAAAGTLGVFKKKTDR